MRGFVIGPKMLRFSWFVFVFSSAQFQQLSFINKAAKMKILSSEQELSHKANDLLSMYSFQTFGFEERSENSTIFFCVSLCFRQNSKLCKCISKLGKLGEKDDIGHKALIF